MPAPARPRDRADACPGVVAPHDAADGPLARVRLPGGAIDAAALRVVAGCARELGDGRVHLTSRGNLQLRAVWRTPEFVARLRAAGLLPSTTHERVRNVLASPLAGDPAPAAALDRGLCARPELAALPGRFLFALDDGSGDVAGEEPDLCWRAPDRLLVAGVDTGLRVGPDDAVDALLDAAAAFLALRGTAWRAAEVPDAAARVAAALGSRPRGAAPPPAAARPTPRAAVPGPTRTTDGRPALVVAPPLGELTADQVDLLADAAPHARVTPWRTVVLLDPRHPVPGLAAPPVSACAGRPGCAKSRADVRADARAVLGRVTDRLHVSGCERRCGAPRGPHVDAVAQEGGGYLVDGVAGPLP